MREIDENCLETRTTKCLIYTGEDIPDLDIKNGDSIQYVIQQLSTKTDIVDNSELLINTFNIPVLSTCASVIVNTAFSYTIQTTASNLLFSWDIPNFLPAGYSYVGTTVRAIADGTIAESSSRGSSLNIPLNRIPANITIEQRVSSSCGDIILSKVIPITATLTGTFQTVFDIKDLGNSPSELSIEQAFDQVFNLVLKTQQQIDDFKATNVQSELSVLDNKIQEVDAKEVSTEVTYLDSAVSSTKEISDIITDIYSILRTNEANIKVLFSEIEGLKVQIANVS